MSGPQVSSGEPPDSGIKTHSHIIDQDASSLFFSGNRNSKHNHPRSIRTTYFFQSQCAFLYKRVSEEKQQKPVTIDAVKGDLRKHIYWKKVECNTFPITEHIPVICRKKGKVEITNRL